MSFTEEMLIVPEGAGIVQACISVDLSETTIPIVLNITTADDVAISMRPALALALHVSHMHMSQHAHNYVSHRWIGLCTQEWYTHHCWWQHYNNNRRW